MRCGDDPATAEASVSGQRVTVASSSPERTARVELLDTIITSAVVALVGWLVIATTKGNVDELARSVDKRFDAVDKRFDAVDKRFDAVDRRFERIETSIDGLRSDLTQVALAVGVPRREATNG